MVGDDVKDEDPLLDFKDRFLDSKHSIKEEVHEKLKRYSYTGCPKKKYSILSFNNFKTIEAITLK